MKFALRVKLTRTILQDFIKRGTYCQHDLYRKMEDHRSLIRLSDADLRRIIHQEKSR